MEAVCWRTLSTTFPLHVRLPADVPDLSELELLSRCRLFYSKKYRERNTRAVPQHSLAESSFFFALSLLQKIMGCKEMRHLTLLFTYLAKISLSREMVAPLEDSYGLSVKSV